MGDGEARWRVRGQMPSFHQALCAAPAPYDLERRITGLALCQVWVLSEMG